MLALPKQIRQTCDIDGYSTKFISIFACRASVGLSREYK